MAEEAEAAEAQERESLSFGIRLSEIVNLRFAVACECDFDLVDLEIIFVAILDE